MNGKRLFFISLVLVITTGFTSAQSNWELRVNKEGIQVYTKNMDNSPLKAVKTVCTINTSLTALTAVLLDIGRTAEWVYATKKVALLKQISPGDLIYYSELDIPWPVSNRDFIVELLVTQDEKTKVVTVAGLNMPTYLPASASIVRIQQSYSKWQITPLQKGQVKIEYELQVDPGGKVPAWLINMFATKGPFETFIKLREQVKKAPYVHTKLAFLKE